MQDLITAFVRKKIITLITYIYLITLSHPFITISNNLFKPIKIKLCIFPGFYVHIHISRILYMYVWVNLKHTVFKSEQRQLTRRQSMNQIQTAVNWLNCLDS